MFRFHGSTQRVLVPQVYVRVKPGDIDGSGALISGRSVDMKLSGDLRNESGTIAGRTTVRLDADNVHNLGGRITGNDVSIKARTDLDNIGGTIDAASRVKLDAGRDIRIESTTRTATSSTGALPGKGGKSGVDLADVALDRVAGVYVTGAGGTLTATAGRDIHLSGAQLQSAGDLSLKAGRDLNIDSVTTGRQEDIRWNGKMSRSTTESTETGTTIAAAGSATLKADRDITARAATLSAGDTLTLDAGRDLTLYAGQNQTSAETSHATKNGMNHYSLDATSQQTSLARTTLSATDIRLRSGNDTVLAAIEANANTLDIQTDGKLIFATQTTTEAASRQEAKGDAAFVSASGKGHVDETTHYNQLNVGTLKIVAKGGVTAQIGEHDTQATLAQQPGMGWVDQIANDPALGRVDWQRVQEAHDKWQYRQSGLGPVAAAVVSLVVGVATAGAGTAVMGASATAYPATTAAIQAGGPSAADQAQAQRATSLRNSVRRRLRA